MGLGLFSPWVRLSAASNLINSSTPWGDLEAPAAAGALLDLSGRSVQDGQASRSGRGVCPRAQGHRGTGNAVGWGGTNPLPSPQEGALGGRAAAETEVFLGLSCTELLARDPPGQSSAAHLRCGQRPAGHSGLWQVQPVPVCSPTRGAPHRLLPTLASSPRPLPSLLPLPGCPTVSLSIFFPKAVVHPATPAAGKSAPCRCTPMWHLPTRPHSPLCPPPLPPATSPALLLLLLMSYVAWFFVCPAPKDVNFTRTETVCFVLLLCPHCLEECPEHCTCSITLGK